MKLYAHPFSSYCQKVLIALYENATPFEYRSLEDPAANAELAALWPLQRFPVLVNEGRTIMETSTIIEYLQIHQPGPVRLIPECDAGIEVRMLDRVFDNYVMTRMQKIVANQLRPEAYCDSFGVMEARGLISAWWAAPGSSATCLLWLTALQRLHFSMRTGFTKSRSLWRTSEPIGLAC